MSDYANDVDDILAAMSLEGGHFVKHLATLYLYGDSHNRHRLEQAFSDYFRRYDAIVTARKARGLQ